MSGQGGRADVEGIVNIEETASEAVARGIRRWWLSGTIQSKTAALRLLTSRPSALVVAWPTAKGGNVRKRLAVMTYEDFVALVQQAGAVNYGEAVGE